MRTLYRCMAAVMLLVLLGWGSSALADDEAEYSVLYSPPERVEALFAAFVDAMPLQTREDALKAFQAMWDESAKKNDGKPKAYYWTGLAGTGTDESDYLVREDDIAPLEDEFGDMPEYWQLRYFVSETDLKERIRLLQKATEVAPDDAVSLYLYWRVMADTWGPYRGLGLKYEEKGQAGLTPEELNIYRNWPQLPAEGMERAARMEGGNAMMYYWTAQMYARLGEYEHVLELLELGNNCPHNVEVNLFPASYMYARLDELTDMVGANRVGCLATLKMYLDAQPLPNYIKLKDTVKEMCVAANLNGDLEALNTVHRFACRFGETQDARLIQQLVAKVLVGVLSDHVLYLWGPMDPEDVRGFNGLYHKLGMVLGMISGSQVCSRHFADAYTGGWLPSFSYNEEPLKPEELMKLFDQGPVGEEFEIKVLGRSIAGIFEDMESFDYTDPAAYRGY